MRRGAGAGKRFAGDAAGGCHVRQTGQSARPSSDLEERQVSAVRRSGAARDRHHGHLRRTRPGISSASPIRGTTTRRPIARSPITGCRSINISAASSTRFCICSIRASSPAPCTRPATSTWTSRSPACSRRAWWCTKLTRPRTATGSSRRPSRSTAWATRGAPRSPRPASRSRSARSRKCRSRKRTPSIPTTSSPPTAPTPRAGSCCPIVRPSAT